LHHPQELRPDLLPTGWHLASKINTQRRMFFGAKRTDINVCTSLYGHKLAINLINDIIDELPA
jgi:hypothetical protein